MFHLDKEEEKFLRSLNTPGKIQEYLDSIPFNFEENGETCMSPRRVIREQKAHCIEGAMLAGTAFLLAGEPALILSLKVDRRDDDHIVTLFRRNGYWGAISKTNHSVLRFRDPVYKSVRELAMSYFHEYFLVKDGKKTMRGYSLPINLRRFGTSWITQEKDLWNIAETIFDSYHLPVIPKENKSFIEDAHELERTTASVPLYE